jgi:hypothetical protein
MSVRPNARAREAMARAAADLRIVAAANREVVRLENMMADALSNGDLARAVELRREIVSTASPVDARLDMVIREWKSIAGLDPVAWSDAMPKVEPKVEPPLDLLRRSIPDILVVAESLVPRMTAAQCREAIAYHGERCPNPTCDVISMLEGRIRELGGSP